MEDAAADGDVAGPSRPSGQAAAQAGPLSRGQREAVLMQMNQILSRQVSLTVDELMAALAAKGLRYGRQAVKQVGQPECMAGGFGHAPLQVLSIMLPWLVRGCATIARLSSRWVCLHAWRADSVLLLEWVIPIKVSTLCPQKKLYRTVAAQAAKGAKFGRRGSCRWACTLEPC